MAVADFSRINSNIGALNALNSLNNVNNKLGMHQLRLATGKRINSAADDPAGLTIATTFRQRNENLKVALDNIGDAKNLMSVAEGGLNKIQDILLEMRNKSEQAASDTLGSQERTAIQDQLAEFAKEIDDIVDQTTWNGNKLLDGLQSSNFASNKITMQTGAEANETTALDANAGFDDISVSTGDLSNLASITSGSSIGTVTDAAYDILADGSAPAVDTANMNSNLNELDSGTYTVEVVYGGTLGTTSTVRLLDADSNPILIDADGDATGAGAVDTVIDDDGAGSALDLSGTGTAAINFGNGLTVTVNKLGTATPAANGTYTATVDYSKDGTYSVNVGTAADATTYMGYVDSAIDTISNRLQTLGALGSRLSFKEENLSSAQINTEAAYNRIANADMAMNQLQATKYQILQQTATSMLAQANQAPQGLLSLFR